MRSLRKTVLLALVASVVLVLAVLHSWPTRVYSTVDVRYRPGPGAERLLEERLPEPDPSTSTIPYRVRESVARSVSWCVMFFYKTSVQVEGDGCRTPATFYNYLSQTFISWDILIFLITKLFLCSPKLHLYDEMYSKTSIMLLNLK